ncbi:MAG TPA: hypothetical protein VNN79_06610 [Actinomycetota bacterium]|nr:hypothetical protein [Actinomycetota bacterium]
MSLVAVATVALGARAVDASPGRVAGATLRYASHASGTGRTVMVLRRTGSGIELVRAADRAVVARAPTGRAPIVIHGSAGDDTLVVDYSRGNPVPAGGLTWDGGAQRTSEGDAIVVRGGRFRRGEVRYESRPNGVIRLDGSTITYRGLEPMDISGVTIANLTLVLPSTSDTAVLEDNGTAGDAIHRLRDAGSPGTFETTLFSTPTNSLTILMGNGTDTITLQPVDTFGADGVTIDQAESILLGGGLVTSGDVTLKSAGPILQTGAALFGRLAATAGTGITLTNAANSIGTIAAQNSGGAVQFRNSGAATIGTVGSLTGITNTGTTTTVDAASPLNVLADVTSAGTLALSALDSAGPNDDVVIGPGVTVRSTGGNASLNAGDDVRIPASATLQSDAGQAIVNVDAADADPGVGGTFALFGHLSGVTNTVNGNADEDRFLFTPGGAVTGLTVNGGSGTDTYKFDGGSAITGTLTEAGTCTGIDLLRFAEPSGVTIDLGSTAPQAVATGLSLTLSNASGFEDLVGTNHGDHVTGNACGNNLLLRGGNDLALGQGGHDVVLGKDGADQLAGGTETDLVRGGFGDDSLDVADGTPGDTVDGNGGSDACAADFGDTARHCET